MTMTNPWTRTADQWETEERGGRGEMKVKGVKYWVREGNLTQGGEHIMRHICNLLLNGALKICLVLFIDVTLMIFNNNTNKM